MNIYTFHRSEGFYPVELVDDAEACRNAECNPGTISVVNELTKETVWKMKINHSEMVATLVKPGEAILSSMTAKQCHELHMILGISGESGELLDALKKHIVYEKELDRENVIEELGDIEFYLEGLRQSLSITRAECLEANISKLSKRYENFKYSNAQAQERKDKNV